jgi:hypothetical protein
MAKSIRTNDIIEYGSSSTSRPAGGFWEHWFETHSQAHPMAVGLDEHKIWQEAVGIGVLAIKDSKS